MTLPCPLEDGKAARYISVNAENYGGNVTLYILAYCYIELI